MNRVTCFPLLVGLAMLSNGCELLLAPNPDFTHDLESDSESGPSSGPDFANPIECPGCQSRVIFEGLPDTYTDEHAPNQVFGNAPHLRVGDDLETYIRLPNLASMQADMPLSLALELHCTQAEGRIWILAVGESWDEATLSAATDSSLWTWYLGNFEPQVGANVIELADMLAWWQFEQAEPSIKLRGGLIDNDLLECSSREGEAGPRVVLVL